MECNKVLPTSKLKLKLKFTTPAKLPYWMGSAFRGMFGNEIRKVICNDLQRSCRECDTKESCLFYYMYMRKEADRGHAPPQKPIILIPPFFGKEMMFDEEGHLDVDLLFFGDFKKYLPHVLLGLRLGGQQGIGSMRYYGQNRFKVDSAFCQFSEKKVYDEKTIKLDNLKTVDAGDIEPISKNKIKIGFKTPFTGKEFPPPLDYLLSLSRYRLIHFVNEYGNGERIPEFKVEADIIDYDEHYHKLQRRSRRSDKTMFHSYTGVVEYDIKDIDEVGEWLLGMAMTIGCGPDSSFGCGFLQKL